MPAEQRNFVISSCNGEKVSDFGHFKGTIPKNVAKKAAKSLFKGRAVSASKITFCIRETTIGSKKKVYSYHAVKTILDPPIVITRGGVEIKIKTEYTLTAAPVPKAELALSDNESPDVVKPKVKAPKAPKEPKVPRAKKVAKE